MRNSIFLSLFVSLILFSSCSRRFVPLTESIRDKYKLYDKEMVVLQYYISQDVTFTADTSSVKRTIKKGVIYQTDSKDVEDIVIVRKTPGKCLAASGSNLQVRFDTRDTPLKFSVFPDYPTDPSGDMIETYNPKYRLEADYWDIFSGEFTINEQMMYTSSINRDAHLYVDLRQISNFNKKRRVARGETVK